ncbi:asparagine synthase-related protein [Patescibacteria group bacterium]
MSDRFLQKVDRTSMAYSLECRSPFLDKEIIEYSCRIPTKWKTN